MFAGAGTQFDPGLIRHFAEYLRAQGEKLTQTVINRWLYDLRDRAGEDLWKLSTPARSGLNSVVQNLFQEQLLQNMHDGVVFVDVNLRILKWNQALELLTGIPAAAAEQQLWDPAIVQLRDEHYKLIPREKCPVLEAIRSGQGSKRRLFVSDAEQGKVSIDAQISPVIGSGGDVYGVALLLQDASSRITLEERVESLRKKARRTG